MVKKSTGGQRSQVEKFRETARALETDEDEGKFNDVLRRVAKAPPPKDDSKKADKDR